MVRAIIKVTDMDALEAYGKEKGFDLVATVTERRENSKLLRKLVHNAAALKQEIPGVSVTYNKKDPNQSEIEESIAKALAQAAAPAKIEEAKKPVAAASAVVKKTSFIAKRA